ncbi:hypothetical protein DPMN_114036 [Dreissena polymorpha]|uniref:Uncharacterized protein n=1 Tax=Dreissena polymorpha TaxID=45954 RepID=A0A9D4QRC6_DREPO|nr:hypothetical protein DPMN_114036 [Dreissena polymorpha]
MAAAIPDTFVKEIHQVVEVRYKTDWKQHTNQYLPINSGAVVDIVIEEGRLEAIQVCFENIDRERRDLWRDL